LADWGRALFALVATLALLGLLALGARRLGMAQFGVKPGAPRRMAIAERLFIDPRRQLVIVRIDQEDHILLLSATGDRSIAVRPAHAPQEISPEAPS
jgi:flagellar protein FliO/FliZ